MHKKNILFVIDSLNIGGAERSLVTLLNCLDYNKFNIDLQLFQYNGKLETFLIRKVNILKPLYLTQYLNSSTPNQLKKPNLFIRRIFFSFLIRIKNRSTNDLARIYWKYFGSTIESTYKKYDIAIAYGQRIPTFYVIDKVKAINKLCWINAYHNPNGKNLEYERYFYKKADKIITVSEVVNNLLSKEVFPEFKRKLLIIHDPIDHEFIYKLSSEDISFNFNKKDFYILTVSRLDKDHKGLDISLRTAIALRNKDLNFKWLIIGEGDYRKELLKAIKKENLEDNFILLGEMSNPYPYFRLCDIYVQTSRCEGYGISIEEAKLFNKPIVITSFNTAHSLIKHNINGIISSFEPDEIADNILRYKKDIQFKKNIIDNLTKEKKGNLIPISQFENLILNLK